MGIGLDDDKRLRKIDRLTRLGVGSLIPLPQLVVVGDQSSGKSSVLGRLTGINFPRDSSLCTRFATHIVLRWAKRERSSVSIVPTASCEPGEKKKLESFKQELENMDDLKSRFQMILSQASIAMGISAQSPRTGESPFSKHTLRIELEGPDEDHLSVIDVPGIFRTPTEGLTTEQDISLVREMVQAYITSERTIILAVLPANVDVATQEILTMAKEVDPEGRRTLGVLTKPDLVDKGAMRDVLQLVNGLKNKLKLGYCVVRNPGQREREMTSTDRDKHEAEYFTEEEFSEFPQGSTGIEALRKRLLKLLSTTIDREFPLIKEDVRLKLAKNEKEEAALGSSRENTEDQRRFLLNLVERFQSISRDALEAHYSKAEILTEKYMQLSTNLDDTIGKLTTAMFEQGCAVAFDSSGISEDKSEEEILREVWEGMNEYRELKHVLPRPQQLGPQRSEPILQWIWTVYKRSRRLGLPTATLEIIHGLFIEQSARWEALAMRHIERMILHVHQFANRLLSHLCPDEGIKDKIWAILVDRLLPRYTKALEQASFILRAERGSVPITRNRSYLGRIAEIHKQRQAGDGDKLPPEGRNDEDTVHHIHAMFKAYYYVALERFIDNICIQVTSYHLVSGPETPLAVFSTDLVLNLTPDKLKEVSGEENTSIQRRRQLGIEKRLLRDALEFLKE